VDLELTISRLVDLDSEFEKEGLDLSVKLNYMTQPVQGNELPDLWDLLIAEPYKAVQS